MAIQLPFEKFYPPCKVGGEREALEGAVVEILRNELATTCTSRNGYIDDF